MERYATDLTLSFGFCYFFPLWFAWYPHVMLGYAHIVHSCSNLHDLSPNKLHHFICKHVHNLFYVMQPLFHYWWDCYCYHISCIYISSIMPNVLHLLYASQAFTFCNISHILLLLPNKTYTCCI